MILKLNKHFNGFFDKISSDQELFRVRSRDQGKISSIKNLDPGRGWFYSPYESDYPLISESISLKKYASPAYALRYAPSNEIFITDYVPPNVFIFSQWLVNRPNQLIRQYFTRQLVQVSLFANILPLQNFPTYGSHY